MNNDNNKMISNLFQPIKYKTKDIKQINNLKG